MPETLNESEMKTAAGPSMEGPIKGATCMPNALTCAVFVLFSPDMFGSILSADDGFFI